jgi:hypothetical protein
VQISQDWRFVLSGIAAGRVVERTQVWMNGYGKLPRCTGAVVDYFLYLAAAIVNSSNEPASATAGTPDPPSTP